ncbi:hypothetical protein [Shewanella sp. GD04112]|uniref:hypothetical protein n=1 Tax=Shewanella sp. GD04112 TaxID=2975434 RepID=UPI00244CA0A6|nr:hypothetical protein [Shewanella sp. GD04112]MDH0447937.1 hypothetical protein [Shewanella sp. GD04112]
MCNINLTVVVVIYNKNFFESSTLTSLLRQNFGREQGECNLVLNLFDNSSDPCISEDELRLLKNMFSVNYKHDNRNLPLSEIYSSQFKDVINGHYILILDDDTDLPCNFIANFFNDAIKNLLEPNIVFLPKVNVSGNLISPYKSYFVFSRPINSYTSGRARGLSAINSGIIIKKSELLDSFSYPMYSSFYGTDTVLFDYFNKNNYNFWVMDLFLEHDLSFHPSSDKKIYLSSLSKVINFWVDHYSKSNFKSMLLRVYIFLLSLKLSLKYKEFINLFKYFK